MSDESKELERGTVKVSEVLPADYNPRGITQKDMADLVRSIEQFGFVEPIVVNKRNMRVVGGHQRIEAAMKIGIQEVPCVYVDLDEGKERALNLGLNKIGGFFNDYMVAEMLESMNEADAELGGYDLEELEKLNKKMHPPEDGEDGVKEVSFTAREKSDIECPECGHKFKP